MENKITVSRLSAMIALATGQSGDLCEKFLTELFGVISDELAKGEKVRIKGLGTFKLADIEARKSVDIGSGEEIEIPAHRRVVFVAAKELAARINLPFEAFEAVEVADGLSTDLLTVDPDGNRESDFEASAEIDSEEELDAMDEIASDESYHNESENESRIGQSNTDFDKQSESDFDKEDDEGLRAIDLAKPVISFHGNQSPLREQRLTGENTINRNPEALYNDHNHQSISFSVDTERAMATKNQEETPFDPQELNIPRVGDEEEEKKTGVAGMVEKEESQTTDVIAKNGVEEEAVHLADDSLQGEKDELVDMPEEGDNTDAEDGDKSDAAEMAIESGAGESGAISEDQGDDNDPEAGSKDAIVGDLEIMADAATGESAAVDEADDAADEEFHGDNDEDIYNEADEGGFNAPYLEDEEGLERSKSRFGRGFLVGFVSAVALLGALIFIGLRTGLIGGDILKTDSRDLLAKHETDVPVLTDTLPTEEDEPGLADSLNDKTSPEEVATHPSDDPLYDTISNTRFLTTMAQHYYGNFNLWPIIYKENEKILGHPDRIKPGTKVVVPPLSKYNVDPANPEDVKRMKNEGAAIYARFK